MIGRCMPHIVPDSGSRSPRQYRAFRVRWWYGGFTRGIGSPTLWARTGVLTGCPSITKHEFVQRASEAPEEAYFPCAAVIHGYNRAAHGASCLVNCLHT